MDGLFKGFLANQAPGIFWGKLDLAYWVPTNWAPANWALANLAPDFFFANLAPKITLAANWAQKNFNTD